MTVKLTKGEAIRILILAIGQVSLAACSPGDDIEWIDIPLSENTFYEKEVNFATDIIEIPLFANSDLEFKLTMAKGNAVSYRWHASDLEDPEKLLAEFHGHTIRTTDEPGDVMFYQISRGSSAKGYLVAPFAGIHGWYLSNESNKDITVSLTVSGFYLLN